MLVLSRKKNESIVIADDIKITITGINRDKVRVGIEAPPRIPVHRREVYDAIQREVNRSGETVVNTDAASTKDASATEGASSS